MPSPASSSATRSHDSPSCATTSMTAWPPLRSSSSGSHSGTTSPSQRRSPVATSTHSPSRRCGACRRSSRDSSSPAGLNYRTHVIDLMVDQRVGSPGRISGVEEIRAEGARRSWTSGPTVESPSSGSASPTLRLRTRRRRRPPRADSAARLGARACRRHRPSRARLPAERALDHMRATRSATTSRRATAAPAGPPRRLRLARGQELADVPAHRAAARPAARASDPMDIGSSCRLNGGSCRTRRPRT